MQNTNLSEQQWLKMQQDAKLLMALNAVGRQPAEKPYMCIPGDLATAVNLVYTLGYNADSATLDDNLLVITSAESLEKGPQAKLEDVWGSFASTNMTASGLSVVSGEEVERFNDWLRSHSVYSRSPDQLLVYGYQDVLYNNPLPLRPDQQFFVVTSASALEQSGVLVA
jgi:hypothetical protein